MKKKTAVSIMTLVILALLAAGCGTAAGTAGSGQGQDAEAQTEETSEEAAAQEEETAEAEEPAQEQEETAEETADSGERPAEAYLSGINAVDYVEVTPDYASLTVEVAAPAEVTDEDINNSISSTLNAHRELREIEGRSTVQEGDIANIDYKGFLDGEAFDGGSAEDFNLEIGSGSFIDGFESGLIGAEVGEEVELNLTFPENYPSANLAGKETVFKVTVNSIQEYVVPDFTDDFVAGLGITDDFGNAITTAEAYRTYVNNNLIEENETTYSNAVKNSILDQLLQKSKFAEEMPAPMVDRFYEQIYDEYSYTAQYYGTDLPTLMGWMGADPENYEEAIRNLAEGNAKSYIVLQAIAEKENLLLSDEDYAIELEKYVERSQTYNSVDDVDRETREGYREYLNSNNTMNFLVTKTTVAEPSVPEETEGAATGN